MAERSEKDFLGEKLIPQEAYWGIHTQRARHNFSLSSYRLAPLFIKALAAVKKACCLANFQLGFLDKEKSGAIICACDEIMEGGLDSQFPVDELQAGAGTSANMNINEVVANRAIELLGKEKGDYGVIHPLEHVNLHQSTNDVFPTALRIACIWGLRALSVSFAELQGAFQKKEKEFAQVIKIGRSELQEAVPVTMGAEFSAFAEAVGRDRWRTFKCEERLRVVNIGGTAVGTGLTAPRSYIFLVIEKLREVTAMPLSRGENIMGETANADSFVEASGVLKASASNLIKISNDLRILQMLGEIKLPAVQAGSSIMPGKVNPVIPEAAIQAGIKVIANDLIVTESASRGSLQISEFMPLLAFAILESISLLNNAVLMLKGHLEGVACDAEKCRQYLDHSPTIITAFLPRIGYDRAAELVKEFSVSGKGSIREFLAVKLGDKVVEEVLSPHNLTSLGYREAGK